MLRSDDPRIDGALSSVLGRDVRLSASPVAGNEFEEVWPEIEGLAPQQFIDATTVGRETNGDDADHALRDDDAGAGRPSEDRDTLRTIARNNRKEIPGHGTWACAGVYAGVTAGGEVAVGDRVELPG